MLEKLQLILSEELNLDKGCIQIESSLYDDLDVDSLSLFSIIEIIEKEFEISIPDGIEIFTVGDMIDAIKDLQNQSSVVGIKEEK